MGEDLIVELKIMMVDAGNIDEAIGNLLEEKNKDRHNKNIASNAFWHRPLEEQVDDIAKKWTDPESDGTGALLYSWQREPTEEELETKAIFQ